MILIQIQTNPDGFVHGPFEVFDSVLQFPETLSPNTIQALKEAYDRGDWQPYTPPEPEIAPPEPNPAAFRTALAQNQRWLEWASTLPSVLYTNLAVAAAQDNWQEAQALYDALIDGSLPPTGAAAEWQVLADTNGIPITF